MDVLQQIKNYVPFNEQEEKDKEIMIRCMETMDHIYERKNETAHMTASAWVVNEEHTKVLMAYHKIYDSFAWLGGHADGETDLLKVAQKEALEESGIAYAKPVSEEIFSLEILPVSGHEKRGKYVPSHLHLNVTYLLEAKEAQNLTVNEEENTAVKWFLFEDALKASKEPWFVDHIYKKLIKKHKQY